MSQQREREREDGGAETLSESHHISIIRFTHQHDRLSYNPGQSKSREEEVPGPVSPPPELSTQ